MKSLVIVYSYHHKNTEKIARVIADKIDAEVKHFHTVNVEEIKNYDLIGFGAGIDNGKHYEPLRKFAESLHDEVGKKAFLFSTSGIYGEKKMFRDHTALRDILLSKGYSIVGEFSCVGFNTNSVLKFIGGINKGRPNTVDLKRTENFADTLIK